MNWFILTGAAIGILATVYVAACILFARIFTNTDRSQTWPLRATPGDVGLAYEDVLFKASDGLTIAGWWLPAPGGTVVVMVPGAGTNRLADNVRAIPEPPTEYLELAGALLQRGYSILMYDPRSTGASEGNRSSYGSLERHDLLGALDWLAERGYQSSSVAVLASSMGCATAMFALETRSYAGLIADSPLGGFSTDDIVEFASAGLRLPKAVARPLTIVFMHGVFLAGRLLWGMRLAEQPLEKLRSHPIPTLVIHGGADRTIPVRVGEQVAAAAGAKLIGAHYLDGVDHCQAYATDPSWYVGTVASALEIMFKKDAATPAGRVLEGAGRVGTDAAP